MKKLGPRGQRWLKSFHSFFACMWVGAALVSSVKQFFINPTSGGELYGITSTMDFIDIFIIIPGAIGVLLTGVIFSLWTNWGWLSITGFRSNGSFGCSGSSEPEQVTCKSC